MQDNLRSVLGKFGGMGRLFHLCVTIPFLVSILYFGIFSSNVYVSESRFIVRSPNKPETNAFGMLLKSSGFSSGDEIHAANDYLLSRDALRELNRNNAVARSYGDASVSLFNRFNPIGWDHSFESLYEYFDGKVEIQYESSTSISRLSVKAFNPQDARRFNEKLLEQAESLVNRLNARARKDLLDVAQKEVDRSRSEARQAASALAEYRDRAGIVDPEKQAVSQIQMVSKLQDELIASRIQLQQLRALVPESSEIAPLQGRVAGLESAITEEMQRAAGGKKSLSNAAAEYQRRLFDDQFAQKQLAATLGALEEARLDTLRKQAYVERIVQPSLPDDAALPHRLRGIFSTLAMGFIAWGILSMLLASFRDHME